MNKAQSYTVAGHTFRISVPEDEIAWKEISSAYSPFEELTDRQPLFTLTVGNSIDPQDVQLILKDANPRAEDPKMDAYRTSNGYLFEMRTPFTDELNCRLHISDDFLTANVVLLGNDIIRVYGLSSALMLSFLLATISRDTIVMHASAVVNKGNAYLFLGRSGTGKSTHSRLWLQFIPETKLLNDDHPIIRIDKDGNAIAYGSPWSGKTPCYHNESAPIGGIVRIKRGSENRIKQLSPIEAYASLHTSNSGMAYKKELADSKDRTLQKIISRVSCYTLECLPNKAAAQLCAVAVKKEEQCNG